ncbi:helix-turn-helix domain-containing protein [Niallia sp. Sow4_A1]|uniref:helix-turn-helix domain-containing protein n=1 Tax=Niallia sp. Sow4_A1 TaxID=3438793 RepID=UPI003F964B76
MIGERIKYLRLRKGYSISRLAKEAGVSKTYLSNLDRGIQNNPSLQFLEKVAERLGITVDQLISDEFKQEDV